MMDKWRISQHVNPFRPYIVEDAWAESTDISGIAHDVTEEILKRIEYVRSDGISRAVLILAPHGAGKTHFLMRMRRLAEKPETGKPPFFFSYVPPFVRPDEAHLHFLDSLVTSLRRSESGGQLAFGKLICSALMNHSVFGDGKLLPPSADGGCVHSFVERSLHSMQKKFRAFPKDLSSVFKAMFCSEKADCALEALTGSPLHADDLSLLKMDADFSGDRAWQVISGFGVLARHCGPLVIGLDQIETIAGTGHENALVAFSELMSGLRSHMGSAVMVFTCLLERWNSGFKDIFEKIGLMDWFGDAVFTLKAPEPSQLKELIEARNSESKSLSIDDSQFREIVKRARTPREFLRECAKLYDGTE